MGGVLLGCALEKESRLLGRMLEPGLAVVTTGLGGARTGRFLERRFREKPPRVFIFAGTAGQLDLSLNLGDVVLPEEWRSEHGECARPHPELIGLLREKGWRIEGRGLSVSRPVVRPGSRRRLHRRHQALICDMETAAALSAAERRGVPALGLKVVSDTAQSGLLDFWKHFPAHMDILGRRLARLLADLS